MMKKISALILALALALTLSLPAMAEEDDRQISVTGSATVSIDADFATIEVGATTRGNSAHEAQKANDKIMQDVIAALAALGVKGEDVRTSMFSIYMDQSVPYGMASDAPVQPPYVVSNMLYITIKDLGKVTEVIDAAAEKGANNVYSLTFQANKNLEANREAINLAVKDAQMKAEILAEAAGKTLGDVIRISFPMVSDNLYSFKQNLSMAEGNAGGAPILSGKVAVTAEVTMVFGFR